MKNWLWISNKKKYENEQKTICKNFWEKNKFEWTKLENNCQKLFGQIFKKRLANFKSVINIWKDM